MESYSMDSLASKNNLAEMNRNTGPQSEQHKRKGAKGIVYRFFHYTTINGLQRLASAKTILGRLFWILVVLGAFSMFSKDIFDLVNQYFERPVSVVSRINYFRAMDFPAITVCNVNSIRLSSPAVKRLKDSINERNNNPCFREDKRESNKECNEEEDEFDAFDDEINYLLAMTDKKTLKESGHQFRKLIVGCRFNGIRCRSRKYWTQFWDPQYGNCYTFNSRLTGNQRNASLFNTRSPGSANGLKLEFNIELHEYIPELTRDAGIKLTITGPNEMPFPIYQSLSLAPGFRSDVAMRRIQIKRTDRFNNGSCRVDKALGKNNNYRTKYNATYSVQACLQQCYAQSQIAKCGCAEYAFLTAASSENICNETNKKLDHCLEKWKNTHGECDQICRDPCEETIFETSVTFTEWPSAPSVESVLESLGQDFDVYNNSVLNVKSNFLAANVFFEKFRETQIEESLSYETANLLADIGGQIGLWAGLSVISMCELIELVALLLRHCLRGKRN